MRNVYQENALRRKGMTKDDWDDYGDHMYHMNKENGEYDEREKQAKKELEQADKVAGLMDRFYEKLREPKA